MSRPTRIHNARVCLGARRLWTRHHQLMQTNARYARAVVEGTVRALWQRSIERCLVVLAHVVIEVYKILREHGFKIETTFDA